MTLSTSGNGDLAKTDTASTKGSMEFMLRQMADQELIIDDVHQNSLVSAVNVI